VTVPDGADEFEALGKQWNWSYRFPGEDGEFGAVAVRFMTPDNPFGIDPDDENGQDDVLVLDHIVHLPVDRPVKANLRSIDVLHNFTVPQFRVKMDLVPGLETYLWFTPTETGGYDVLCEEYCGLAHHTMRGRVVVDEQEDFETWLASHPTFAQTQARPTGDAQLGAALYAPCAACHGADGAGNPALNAPKLSGQEEWYMRRQLRNYKLRLRGTDPSDVNGMQMAAMVNTLADDAAISNVVAYIRTLPDAPAPATVSGDVEKGRSLYTTCAACHGDDGMGVWSVGAPRQAGMSDWYLADQLRKFKTGVRGAHGGDNFGRQMGMMAMMLLNDQAVDDVVAYINTLPAGQPSQLAAAPQSGPTTGQE
jgi:cytochrome c oxidase subunit 2